MPKGWSNEELSASVEAYRQMSEKEEAGVSYSKKQVYQDLAARFDRTTKAFEYRMQNISAVRDELGMKWISGLKPAVNVGTDMKHRLVQLIQGKTPDSAPIEDDLSDSRTWEKALAAVIDLRGNASRKQVEDWILARDPAYNTKNLADLYMMSVNSPSRTAYGPNAKPRRTDQGSQYDRLFKVGHGKGSVFELYDQTQHGIWEIYPDASAGNQHGMAIRRLTDPVAEAIAAAEDDAEKAGAFDPTSVTDSRKRVMADIIRRRGQPAFRKALMEAYGGACAITGCNLPAVLEAAHVHPYKGDHTNVVSNGLLLRADIHTLFDLGLVAIESESMVVRVSPELAGSEYEKLEGLRLRAPRSPAQRVSSDALDWHWSQCGWSS